MGQDFETQVSHCNDAKGDPDIRIAACTSLLNSGDLVRDSLAPAYNNRGNAYADKGQHDLAIEDYDRAIGLDATNADFHYNRGFANSDKGEHDRAIQDYDHAIRLNPDHGAAYHNRGKALTAKRQFDRAITDFDHAIRLDPNHAEAHLYRALAHEYSGRIDRAVHDYEQATRLNPDDANAFNNFAWLRATAKDRQFRDGQQAVRLALRAVELDGGDPNVHGTLAVAYIEAGAPEPALAAYRRAMEVGKTARVMEYQQDLRKKRLYAGAIDGKIGPATEAALKACVRARCKLMAD